MAHPSLRRFLALPKQTPGSARGRSCRVVTLIFTIVLLSMADLYITLLYLHSGGMGEANPVARWIMGHGSPSLLVAWKLGTVAVAVALFYWTRRTRTAELGAWFCVVLLTWLTIRWHAYSEEAPGLIPSMHTLGEHEPAKWMTMTPDP